MTWTKEKQREYHRAWSKRNKDRIRQYREKRRAEQARLYKAWRARNPDRIKEHARRYRETHRDTVRARVARFNQSKGRQYSANYRSRNPEKRAASCARYRATHQEHDREYRQAYAQSERGRVILNAKAAARRAAKRKATPAWANREAMETIYARAAELSLDTGIQHDVDHIIPLLGKSVCGLHVEDNLQIIPHVDNLRKGNRHAA